MRCFVDVSLINTRVPGGTKGVALKFKFPNILAYAKRFRCFIDDHSSFRDLIDM